jgi:hypothetical protein
MWVPHVSLLIHGLLSEFQVGGAIKFVLSATRKEKWHSSS